MISEFVCESCGAIYVQHDEKMPSITCTCKGKEFKLVKTMQPYAS